MGGRNDSALPIHITAAIRRRGQTDRTNLLQAEAAQKGSRHLRSGSELRALSYHTTATRPVPGTFGQSGKISAHPLRVRRTAAFSPGNFRTDRSRPFAGKKFR